MYLRELFDDPVHHHLLEQGLRRPVRGQVLVLLLLPLLLPLLPLLPLLADLPLLPLIPLYGLM